MADKLWHKSYAAGVPKSIDYEKRTISEALAGSAEKFPNRTALNYMGKRINYKTLNDMVNQFARALQEMGIKPGDKVGVSLPNIPQVIISNLAIFRIGAVSVQNNPLYTKGSWPTSSMIQTPGSSLPFPCWYPACRRLNPRPSWKRLSGATFIHFCPFPRSSSFLL